MSEFPYESSYEPALPVCEVTLSVATSGHQRTLLAVIDAGADTTLVPLDHLTQLGARRVFEANLRSQWGERRVVYLYLVDIRIDKITLPGIFVVGEELGQEVVLGRDVLNRVRILLDGPAKITRILGWKAKRRSE